MQKQFDAPFFLEYFKDCKSFSLKPEMLRDSFELVIGSIDLPLTTKCNLKCKHCGSLMDLYRHPVDVELGVIISSLERLLSAADLIVRVNVLGGEPFLYPYLEYVLNYLQESDRIAKVYIPTNGLYLPQRPRLFDALRESKIMVRISHYDAYEKRVEKTKKTLEDEGITYSVKEFGPNDFLWYDFGGFELRSRSEDELIRQYKNCEVEWYSLFNGRLFPCPRAAHAADLGLIEAEESFVDVMDTSVPVEDLRKTLQDFIFKRKYHPCCRFCDRGTGKCPMIRVAEQVRSIV